MILTKSGYTDDSRLDEDYIGYKVDEYRAIGIRQTFSRHPVIEPIWVQDLLLTDTTPVNTSDDDSVAICRCEMSKVTLPPIVSLSAQASNTNDVGVVDILSGCGTYNHFYRPIHQLQLLTSDDPTDKFHYYWKIMNTYYFRYKEKKIRPMLILERPLDGFINDNEYKTVLTVGLVYEVVEGQVVHNSLAYQKGQTFTAVTTSFTGNGKVKLNNRKRQMTGNDPYPMSHTMTEMVVLSILTKEYQIEKQQIADIRNDGQDPVKEQGQ